MSNFDDLPDGTRTFISRAIRSLNLPTSKADRDCRKFLADLVFIDSLDYEEIERFASSWWDDNREDYE